MYVVDLNGAKPIVWKAVVNICPRDCGGAEYDEIEYSPHCPNCDKDFGFSVPKYCPECGTKLYSRCSKPYFDD